MEECSYKDNLTGDSWDQVVLKVNRVRAYRRQIAAARASREKKLREGS